MSIDHLQALLKAAGASAGDDGFQQVPEGRLMTLYVASSGGSGFTINRVEAVRTEGDLLHARTVKGELFIVSLSSAYAGAVEGPTAASRKAGFVSHAG